MEKAPGAGDGVPVGGIVGITVGIEVGAGVLLRLSSGPFPLGFQAASLINTILSILAPSSRNP